MAPTSLRRDVSVGSKPEVAADWLDVRSTPDNGLKADIVRIAFGG
jgi:hypothetical protein